ncbi:MAG: 30S ribosomal protein S20 [Candidatus Colwellbacteria bacterium RIFCSPLOWO2_01_FULL_48_10]|uniref:Small ribosomal subunit protein bS20 n=1 Tax=Candidatus Colwellbacteria bacterium RIFCSPLOWO2_01_FULL_48_10 TaxID=1797690 RepID=A0A1G1Z9V3_9BACT|nr:MAG: 30S ribosomal protein S20 [Candidatus Colwellbacteria bacterium RIFCSPLOWO2_01_FULL_48_10]
MPKTTSAKKALRQNIKRRAQNIERAKNLKKVMNSYLKLIDAKKFDEAAKQLPAVYKVLDKSAKVNLIKKNKASRLKSRLTQRLKSTKASS